MWYKYLDRRTDAVRLWRTCNLKFNQDEIGMFKNKYISKWDDFVFRMGRSEGVLRGSAFLFFLGLIPAIFYIKSEYYDPVFEEPKKIQARKEQEQKNKKAKEVLYYNKFGAPTRPARTIDQLTIFLDSPDAINQTFDFIKYCGDINTDQLNGLDSYTTQNDERMIDILKDLESKVGGGH